MISATEVIKVIPMNPKKYGPIALCAKACTDDNTPERVRNVPKMTRSYVTRMSKMFQCLNSPRFSWIMTECRNAVPVSHGMNAAISTGSQPQKQPQPSTSYAQRLPNTKPQLRKSHAHNVQRRVMRIQRSSVRPVINAAIANAYGITKETKPR